MLLASSAAVVQKYISTSEVEGKSSDNPNSLVGEGLDYLVLDECAKMKKVIWEMYLRPTLSDRKGKALFITTPEGYNWIYDLYLLGQDKNEKNCFHIRAKKTQGFKICFRKFYINFT